MKNLLIAIIIGMSMLLSGCAGVFLVGAGVGAGAFSYIAGNLTRVYEADYHQSIKASIKVVEQLNFKQKEETVDELKTIIEGHLNYDTPVTIEVVYVKDGLTQIGVRTGYIGVDNLEMSKQVHADIAEELKRFKPPRISATSRKKIKLLESKPRTSQTLYDDLPPPPMPETVSVQSAREDAQEIIDGQEKQALTTADKKQEIPAEDTAKASESEGDVPPPISETVSAQSAIDTPRIMAGRQDTQTLYPNENISKTFRYYPKSALSIHSGSYGTLDEVISYLGENPSASVDIRAYTDSSGSKARNLALSQKRVFELRNYLILHDIPEETISTDAQGATNFLESNRADGLESPYHRVEIQAVYPAARQQEKSADNKAKALQNEGDVQPSESETVSVANESGIDDTRQMKSRQDTPTLTPTKSNNKTFVYYPKSALTIHSGSYDALDEVISYLDENPSASVDIRAYTDASGNIARNLALSRKRVFELRNYLILHDVPEEIITTDAQGAINFLDSNSIDRLGSPNHRVELTIR